MLNVDIRQTSATLQKTIKDTVEKHGITVKWIYASGLYYEHVFVVAVQSDHEQNELQNNKMLKRELDASVELSGYRNLVEQSWTRHVHDASLSYLKNIQIIFASQESVDRDFNGNWYHAMK